jgi:nucleotide-binding universal stress UspA family protein
MFKRILVPLDLSRHNARALRTAAELARQSRGRVALLHVIARVEHVPLDELRDFYRTLERVARRKLDAAGRRLARRGVEARVAIVIGAPPHEILRYAVAQRIDLIVMASHRVNPARRSEGWGSTSYKVGILCQCPVLLVK